MAEDEDLYEEEFDFVDDEEEDDEVEVDNQEPADSVDEPDDQAAVEATSGGDEAAAGGEGDVDEYGRPSPTANYVIHVYEYSRFKRTIDRPFTPEDAEAFATEYNRTGKSYGRVAVPGKNDAKPKKTID